MPSSECSDATRSWYPQRAICYSTMETEAAQARYRDLHEAAPYHDGTFPDDPSAWSATRSETHPYHFGEGVTIWVAPVDLNPHDHFIGGADECETCSAEGELDSAADDDADHEGDHQQR